MHKPAHDADYDSDFFLWTQQQADALRHAAQTRFNEPLDWENIAEEIESLGKRDRRRVQSLAYRILTHLLKLQFSGQIEPRNHWKTEIRTWRLQLQRVLEDSPSLKTKLQELAEAEWLSAVKQVEQDLSADNEDISQLSALAYLKLLGPNSRNLLDPDFFPAPEDIK